MAPLAIASEEVRSMNCPCNAGSPVVRSQIGYRAPGHRQGLTTLPKRLVTVGLLVRLPIKPCPPKQGGT